MARVKVPPPANVLGLVMGGPVVIAHGTEGQKERFLEPILSAEEIWCQGFSEPESGSDLASLKTKAVPENGGWRVTGQKVWTTFAHEAKWCMLLARSDTDAPEAQGPHLLHLRHGAGRGRGSAAAPDHRRSRVQRDLLRGRLHPGREPGRRRGQRLERRDHDPDARAGGDRGRLRDPGPARSRRADRADQRARPRRRPRDPPADRRAQDRHRGASLRLAARPDRSR